MKIPVKELQQSSSINLKLLLYKLKLPSLNLLVVLLAITLFNSNAFAQAGPERQLTASEIKLALKKVQVLGSVLYMAAHPDDENTRMITYMANERGVRTAYLSLTRGDGGQNLIGKEVREQMGLIRTQELLAARRTDGGEQFFSRANDFGFSKHPDETLQIWDKEKVLGDAVWVIRNFQPDVIITRFSPYRDGKTHGHHTTSAKIALEAFTVAADKEKYKDQLKYTSPWQAERIAWNTSSWFFRDNKDYDISKLLTVDLGVYNPLLGKSYGEIAAESRTMHKSQGFGSAKSRGGSIEYLEHLAGDSATVDILEDIDLTWNRVPGSEKLSALLKKADTEFDVLKPENSVPVLLEAYKEIEKLPQDNHYVKLKKKELEDLIIQCSGIWIDAGSQTYMVSPGDSLYVEARLVKRAESVEVKIKEVDFQFDKQEADSLLPENKLVEYKGALVVPKDLPYSQPYWLVEKPEKGMFVVNDQKLIGKPENGAEINTYVTLEFVDGVNIKVETPVMYRRVDPVDGEVYRPLAIVPPVTNTITEQVFIYANNQAKPVNVVLKASKADVSGKLKLDLPTGWESEPAFYDFKLDKKFEEQNYTFMVKPIVESAEGTVKAVSIIDGKEYGLGLKVIDYPHIPVQTLLPEAEAKLVKINISKTGNRIGYVMGAGDAVPEALRQIGFEVDLLEDKDFVPTTLAQYDAIIMGVRAYNTVDRLKFHQSKLMDYVENGGNLIVQYNTSRRLLLDDLGPYKLKVSNDRVTVEEAEVKILKPNSEILNFPNKITKEDFDGWVQERGLYFPNEWDDKYEAILSMHDPGEDVKNGSLLATKYGKGTYIYTGLSFFRELPAGVPGAYRLLVNLIAYGKSEEMNLKQETGQEK
ncbi:PIG-L family deacetylase [Chondrinema litorale]|uniref:PIG-L family deacetylase n=1 Tax=Chondrinema litorale TaxID=2994555 RepID=UPI00254315D5|nr:PIG-L family deacetylase [Chondrinema litorale]UZR96041.1 PIG-L family deacetylase [Chondrinema litorale]